MLFLTWPFKSSTLALKSFLFTMLILSVNSGFSQQIDFWNRYPYSCLLPGDRLVLDSLSICLLLVFRYYSVFKVQLCSIFSSLALSPFIPSSVAYISMRLCPSFTFLAIKKNLVQTYSRPFRRWWRIRDSNPWPPACKAGALPTELIPRKTHSTELSLLRKEVIQPHLPIRLPCYDFTPVIGFALFT